MADQGIPPGGGVNPPGGDVNTQFLSNSNKNYMKLKDYDAGGGRGVRPKFYYVDPPMQLHLVATIL